MRPKAVVTGASGMLGKDLSRSLERDFHVIPLSRAELDITDMDQVMHVLGDTTPAVVVNCAAFTNVDLCEKKREKAFLVNAKGPENLAKACSAIGAKLVHISTDYVFDGMSQRPYREEDPTNPINVYGQSKLKGENTIQKHSKDYLIVRTSWLFGKEGPNFIKTMLELSKERKELQVVHDQRGRPTSTKDLSKHVCQLIRYNATGTVHCANIGTCTWFDLCCFALEKAGIGNVKVTPVTSDCFKRPARRPAYSVLDLKRFKKITGELPRPWQDAVLSYLNDTDNLCHSTKAPDVQ